MGAARDEAKKKMTDMEKTEYARNNKMDLTNLKDGVWKSGYLGTLRYQEFIRFYSCCQVHFRCHMLGECIFVELQLCG